MIFYFIFFIIIFIMYYLIGANKYKNNFNIYCSVVGIFVFLLFALRDISMGMNDVKDSYVPLFDSIRYLSLHDIINRVSDSYLFYFVTKFVSIFFKNVHIWIAIMSIPICFATYLLIKKYSKVPWMSWIIFFSLGYFEANITIMKQSIAMAFVIFEILLLIKDKSKSAILCWIIACLFHPSALVCFIPIIIKHLKKQMNLKIGITISIVSFIIWHISNDIISYAFNLIKMQGLQKYLNHLSPFNITKFMIFLLIFLFCLFIKNCYSNNINDNTNFRTSNNTINEYFIWIYALSLPFLALTSTFSDVYRISLYFSVFAIILLPNMILSVKNYLLRYSLFAIILSFMIYYASIRGLLNVMPYKTFF